MKPTRLLPALAVLALALIAGRAFAADTTTTPAPAATTRKPAPKHFLITLHLAPRLHDDKAWTDTDKAAVGAHFQRLKAAVDAGQVVLAGRTPVAADKTMGLIVLTAEDEAAARTFMNGDPCVAAGIMLAELNPFDLALLRKS
jgi:uncharacterized protein YciI